MISKVCYFSCIFGAMITMSPLSWGKTTRQPNQAPGAPMKRVFFIGTGGTIAGIAENPTSPTYDPGKVTVDAILKAVPDIRTIADISGQQLIDKLKYDELIKSGMPEAAVLKKPEAYVNGCSCDMSEYRWRLLEDRIERALNTEGYDAVVITHGTDTIEETAFFLEMTVNSDKPVILVGAGRPSNNPQADGPTNIRQAVRVAIDPMAVGKGVMIVMNGKIYPAFDVTEVRAPLPTEPLRDRFLSPNFGVLGEVRNNAVAWTKQNKLLQKNIRKLKFDTKIDQELPKVPILWQYVGNDSSELYQMYRKQNTKAFVLAGYGGGSSGAALKALIKETTTPAQNDTVVIDVSRTREAITDNYASYNPNGPMLGVVVAGTLNPYQAKIFLQLVLMGIANRKEELQKVLSALPSSAPIREKIRAISTEFLYRQMGLPEKI